MRYIRSFFLDVPQFMPTSRFAIKDARAIKAQIIRLLQAMAQAGDHEDFKPMFFEEIHNTNSFNVMSCLRHDPLCHTKLKEWITEYCV
jgi:hypothetical protein